MSDHEHDALDALRSLDGPAELGDGVEARIEADMLARFDERVGSGPVDGQRAPTVVALDDAAERTQRRRSNRRGMLLAAAAAIALVVAGVAVFLARDEPAPANPPETTPPTTDPMPEEASVTDQLATFCAEYLAPTREADALWKPTGRSSEERQNVLIAVESAAQAMSELVPPLGDRLAEATEQLLGAAADARLESTLNSAAADDAVSAVRDLVFAAPEAAGVSTLPDSCLP